MSGPIVFLAERPMTLFGLRTPTPHIPRRKKPVPQHPANHSTTFRLAYIDTDSRFEESIILYTTSLLSPTAAFVSSLPF
jgi:hypothetical protein